jgi:membrane associated rhomboid family serine protease
MFFIIPVGMNYRTERLPMVTFSLIGVNVLVWLVSTVCLFATEGDSEIWILKHLWLTPANFTIYSCFTSLFVHAGFFHLAGNMVYLFLFGACVEDIIGRGRFLAFYLLSGLLAGFVYIAMTPEHFASTIPMGGASGAISGAMGMYLLLRANVDIELRYFIWFIVIRTGDFEIPAWVAIVIYFGLNLLWAVVDMFSQHTGGGTAFADHVGGFLVGLGLVAGWKWLGNKRDAEAENPKPRSRMIIDPAKIMRVTVPAPVAVASETPTIYLHDGFQQTGPFTLSQVQTMLHAGEFGLDGHYWSEGMTDWQSVVDLSNEPAG